MKFGMELSTALVLVLAGAAMAAPTTSMGKTLRIPIVNKGEKYQSNTFAEWSYTLQKYGFKRAAERIAPQGSSRSCSRRPGTRQTHFKRNASSTYRPSDEVWSANFDDSISASGVTGYDIVKLADLIDPDQPVHLAQQMSPDFGGIVDGILGLSFGVLSNTTSVLENMITHKLLDKGVVSFALGKFSGIGGEALFGGIDMSKVADGHGIVYADVISDHYWAVRITNVFVDAQAVFYRLDIANVFLAVIDTGSTILTLPTSLASAIHAKIPRSIRLHDRWYVPCKGTQRLEFEIGGARFGVPYSDIARERSALVSMCHSGVQVNPGNFAIIGDVFIKNNYVVFDVDNRRPS
ncbi:aspartic peptidase domain-containing protein [Linnemannia elongata]|nr:aspartic peptidase domain-containing protein [Linnemannia elongata]